ncbi:sugar phosphate isomerase/epimerase family protein [Actinoplanes rectilineatus]|uniref:sugar phosphate isomerase/epimerase family protein n=1 Tax=Actinoplanes rectilineatus TaxID=113571 RepID=UPI0005F2B3A6|nr:TIM barrel protein [Actinoplanes rectilineatus]
MRPGGIGDEAGRGLDAQLAALDTLGWRELELRTVDGTAIADLDDRAFDRIAGRLATDGITVPCVASRIGNWARPVDGDFTLDRDELARLLPRCGRLGTPYLRVMSWQAGQVSDAEWGVLARRRLRELSERAGEAGVTLVHENCTGWAAKDPDRMRELLRAVPGLRLLFDMGNGIEYGYRARDLLGEILPWVVHVHVKDAARDARGCTYTKPGEGDADVAGCLRTLRDHGYAGVLSLEPHVGMRPHRAQSVPDAELAAGFVAAGRALAELCREAVPCR